MRTRITTFFLLSLATLLLAAGTGSNATEQDSRNTITSIRFRSAPDLSRLEIVGREPLQAEQQADSEDRQIVLTVPGATLSPGVRRSIDVSARDGNVTLVRSYPTGNGDVRIVLQLRNNAEALLNRTGNRLTLAIPTCLVQRKGDDEIRFSAAAPATDPSAAREDGDSEESVSMAPPKDKMDTFLTNSKTKRFSGRPITLQLRDVDVADVFHLISEASGFNIVLSSDVTGKLTLALTEVPWDQALDVVLQTLVLGAERRGNVLRVVPLKNLVQEKIQELNAKMAADAAMPKIERVFPISYADINKLKTTLTQLAAADYAGQSQSSALASLQAGTANKAAAPAVTANPDVTIIADDRTNSLVIRAIPPTMERLRKTIELLDTQTPEVLIESKVVEVNESFARNLNGSFGGANYNNPAFGSFNGQDIINPLFGTATLTNTAPIVNVPGAPGTFASSAGGTLGGQFTLLGARVTSLLNVAENENKAKVISSPRTVVLNKMQATITQGTPVLIPQTTIVNGTPQITFQQATANLSLAVTPQVTSDGSVEMHLEIHKDNTQAVQGAGGTIAVAPRAITSDVLVESGATLVLGGFYISSIADSDGGFPILKDLPIIGWLFGGNNHSTSNDELFFFITPQILNGKKAGISSS